MARIQDKVFNVYGDVLKPTPTGRGADISSQRMDDLDQASLEYIQKNPDIHVLDFGGGTGKHSVRMAQCGAHVTMIDLTDRSQNFKAAEEAKIIEPGQIVMLQKDFESVNPSQDFRPFDMIYSQRALNYLPYDQYFNLMKQLVALLPQKGKLFFSLAGHDTEYGISFPLRDKPVTERFGHVTKDMQEKHGIYEKITTYSQEDVQKICDALGLKVASLTQSSFGNIKTIAHKI